MILPIRELYISRIISYFLFHSIEYLWESSISLCVAYSLFSRHVLFYYRTISLFIYSFCSGWTLGFFSELCYYEQWSYNYFCTRSGHGKNFLGLERQHHGPRAWPPLVDSSKLHIKLATHIHTPTGSRQELLLHIAVDTHHIRHF